MGDATAALAELSDSSDRWNELAQSPTWKQQARTEQSRLDLLQGQALIMLGRSGEAVPLLKRRADRARGRMWNDPENERAILDLCEALTELGEAVVASEGEVERAMPLVREAVDLATSLAARSQTIGPWASWMRSLAAMADGYRQAGMYEEAFESLDRLDEVVALGTPRLGEGTFDWERTEAMLTRAELMRHQRIDRQAALAAAIEGVALLQESEFGGRSRHEVRQALASGWLGVLRLQMAMGQTDEAVTSGQEAVAAASQVLAADPSNVMLQRAMAQANRYLGDALSRVGQLDAGLAEVATGVAHLQEAVRIDPESDVLRRSLAASHYRRGMMLRRAERLDEALACFLLAAEIDEERLSINRDNRLAVADVSIDLAKVAACQVELGRIEESLAASQRAVDLAEASLAHAPHAVGRQRG